ncbi:MAG: anti-sigma factor [bacterium]|nr:anti-sigma factor [bacterium]
MKKIFRALAFVLLLSACGDTVDVEVGFNGVDNVEVIRKPMPTGGKVADLKHGQEEWFAIGSLTGVEAAIANGVAQVHVYADGASLHTAQLNIKRPEDGYFYEGWIIKDGDVISTGHAKSRFGDVRHFIQFETDKNLTGYTKVVITLEPDDGDPAPAGHVAEGVLTHHQR